MQPVIGDNLFQSGLPEKIPEERAQKESDIEEKVFPINWEGISTFIDKIVNDEVWAPNSKKSLTKQELQKLVIELKKMTFTKLSDNVVHLRKRDTQLTRGIEITPEGKIYVLIKDRFAKGTYKTASLAVDLTTGGTVVHATIPFKKGRAEEEVENEIAFGKMLKGPRFVKMLHTTKYKAKDGTWKWGIMMEQCNRGNLVDMIVKDDWNADPEVSWRILEDCLEAMVELEKQDIHHRDIKLENFFLKQDENGKIRAKLGDFGFSTNIEEEKKKPTSKGTSEYLAPEQWNVKHKKSMWETKIERMRNAIKFINTEIKNKTYSEQNLIGKREAYANAIKEYKKNIHEESKIRKNKIKKLRNAIKLITKNINKTDSKQNLLRKREAYANAIKEYKKIIHEQSQKAITLKTDIWSMGIVLYVMQNKRIPFDDEYKDRFQFVPSKSSIDSYFSAETNEAAGKGEEVKTLEQLNRMMLRVDPGKRPSASECLQIIRELRQKKSSFNVKVA